MRSLGSATVLGWAALLVQLADATWSIEPPGYSYPEWPAAGEGAVAVIDDEYPDSSRIAVFDADTGDLRWCRRVGRVVVGPMLVAEGRLYACTTPAGVFVFRLSDGLTEADLRTGAHQDEAQCMLAPGRLLVRNTRLSAPQNSLDAYETARFTHLWRREFAGWGVAAMKAEAGAVHVLLEQQLPSTDAATTVMQVLVELDADDGRTVLRESPRHDWIDEDSARVLNSLPAQTRQVLSGWREQVRAERGTGRLTQFWRHTLRSGDYVFLDCPGFSGWQPGLLALRADTGQFLWARALAYWSVTTVDGRVFAGWGLGATSEWGDGTQPHVVALDASSGNVLWARELLPDGTAEAFDLARSELITDEEEALRMLTTPHPDPSAPSTWRSAPALIASAAAALLAVTLLWWRRRARRR